MSRLFSRPLGILLVVACVAYAQQRTEEPIPLPKLDGNSVKGLEIECRLPKVRFEVGEPIQILCILKNTTDSPKPIGWHPSAGEHFCLVQGDKLAWGGLLPLAIPQLDRPIMIKSKEMQPGYILYIPAHETISISLPLKEVRPMKFRGKIVYDPLDPRNGFVDLKKDGPPWKNEWVSSNEIEYEVVSSDAK